MCVQQHSPSCVLPLPPGEKHKFSERKQKWAGGHITCWSHPAWKQQKPSRGPWTHWPLPLGFHRGGWSSISMSYWGHTGLYTDLQSKHAMFIREDSQSCWLNNFYYLDDLKSNSLNLSTKSTESLGIKKCQMICHLSLRERLLAALFSGNWRAFPCLRLCSWLLSC